MAKWTGRSSSLHFRLRASVDIFAMMGCVMEVKHFSYNGLLRKSREVRLRTRKARKALWGKE